MVSIAHLCPNFVRVDLKDVADLAKKVLDFTNCDSL
jgi:hypothetical protein